MLGIYSNRHRGIRIDCSIGSFVGSKSPWTGLNLDKTQRIWIGRHASMNGWEGGNERFLLWAPLFLKSRRSVQDIEMGKVSPLDSDAGILFYNYIFPRLRSIELRELTFRGDLLALALQRSPNLKMVEFEMCWMKDGPTGWRKIFDFVRNHPGPLTVVFEDITFDHDDWGLKFGKGPGKMHRTGNWGLSTEVYNNIFEYWHGRGPWTDALEKWVATGIWQ